MDKITSEQFFTTWHGIVSAREESLRPVWQNNNESSSLIKGNSDSVLVNFADQLGFCCYNSDYYSLDAIFYKPEDRITRPNPNSFWFRRIRVALNTRMILKADYTRKFPICL